MTEPAPYTYKALYLTKDETKDGKNLGLKFVLKNKDRWEDISHSTYELQTYDKGCSQVVHNNKLYMIHRDFIFVDTQERVFLCKCYDAEVDTYNESDAKEEVKPVVKVNGKYDYLDQNKINEVSKEPEKSESDEVVEEEVSE